MAIFHLHVKNISRGSRKDPEAPPRSVVAAAAYRAGEALWSEAEEKDSHYGGRRDVVFSEIFIPAGAPAWMGERQRLWNAVEAAEKRKDARLAKEIEFALPRELPRETWIAIVRDMADAYVSRGLVVDAAIHEDGRGHNPHAHLMLTTREITADGFGGKLRWADQPDFVNDARALWQKTANVSLGAAGVAPIDARSHRDRGDDAEPTRHRGPDVEKRRQNREAAAMLRDDPALRMQVAALAERLKSPDPDAARQAAAELRERLTEALVQTGVLDRPSAEQVWEVLRNVEHTAQERDDPGDPVPDPDGNPITLRALEEAEERLLEDSHRPAPELRVTLERDAERAAAEEAVERINRTELTDAEADAYRIAPPDEKRLMVRELMRARGQALRDAQAPQRGPSIPSRDRATDDRDDEREQRYRR